MAERVGGLTLAKGEELLGVTRDREFWRAMIAYIRKGRGTYQKNVLFRQSPPPRIFHFLKFFCSIISDVYIKYSVREEYFPDDGKTLDENTIVTNALQLCKKYFCCKPYFSMYLGVWGQTKPNTTSFRN